MPAPQVVLPSGSGKALRSGLPDLAGQVIGSWTPVCAGIFAEFRGQRLRNASLRRNRGNNATPSGSCQPRLVELHVCEPPKQTPFGLINLTVLQLLHCRISLLFTRYATNKANIIEMCLSRQSVLTIIKSIVEICRNCLITCSNQDNTVDSHMLLCDAMCGGEQYGNKLTN